MVGRVRVELTTSRLSGVRSNHLSYRPERRVPVSRSKAAPSEGTHQSTTLMGPFKIDTVQGL